MWSYSENIWPNVQCNWPNVRAFDELRTHLVTVGRIDDWHLGKRAARLAKCVRVWPIVHAFGAIYQTLRNWSNAARLTNWSNALRDCPNAQIGQMRLTALLSADDHWLMCSATMH